MERWRNMTLNVPGGSVTLVGGGFTAIGRLALIEILRKRAEALGIVIDFDTRIDTLDDLHADLVIGADGLNSSVRTSMEDAFKPSIDYLGNHFAWFGAERPFDTLTQTFVETEKGVLNAHRYRYNPDRSTFLVECNDMVFQRYGFEQMGEAESAALCEEIFADVLGGAKLITNKSNWRQFPKLWCENWIAGRYALVGDAVHTAHFSIWSDTRLALEDSIALTRALSHSESLAEAFGAYQSERAPVARKIFDAANASALWYEDYAEKMRLSPLDFAFEYINRSGRMDPERLRQTAPEFMRDYDAAHA